MENDGSRINLAKGIWCSLSDGPGKRVVLWVQGCPRRCQDCGNPQMQRTDVIRLTPKVENVFEAIKLAKQLYNIEGVTFSGGEPFLQSLALSNLASLCKGVDLSIVVFTGYLKEELGSVENSELLLDKIDLLIDGPYQKENPETERNWVGSTNQKFYYLTNRYSPEVEKHLVRGKRAGSENPLFLSDAFSVNSAGEIISIDKTFRSYKKQ